jgi:hypothetical protein
MRQFRIEPVAVVPAEPVDVPDVDSLPLGLVFGLFSVVEIARDLVILTLQASRLQKTLETCEHPHQERHVVHIGRE